MSASFLVRERTPLRTRLRRDPGRPCLSDDRIELTQGQVAERLDEWAERLGEGRRLVQIEMGRDLETVLAYLAAIDAGHAVLPTDADATTAIADRWSPDTLVRGDVDIRADVSGHELHPDLALLLSTSGSTGSPKLVRLSLGGLIANARSIGVALRLTPDDRSVTTLPLHYCYGLSVVHAHMVAGASVHITERSVIDPCFWEAVRERSITNLAGVPHTFDLIDQVGPDVMAGTDLRLITQAGGRLDPDRVARFARIGAEQGWDLVPMYGQTEATARMAMMPLGLAATAPDAVGVAIDEGDIEIRSVDDGGPLPAGEVGRIVYRGPNVMMGYATEHGDLAAPSEHDELVTGDLGSLDDEGLLRITGREARFAKLYGLRIDLQRIESTLSETGRRSMAASDDRRLVVAIEGTVDVSTRDGIAARVAELSGLPRRDIQVVALDEFPRLPTGKPDYRGLLDLVPVAEPSSVRVPGGVADEFRAVLGCGRIEDDDTFVSLGGDSFSYVELSVRLEERIGSLPAAWHLMPIGELEQRIGARSRWGTRVDTTIVLRAAAILLIVSSHMRWFYVPVGAHILLAVAGFNFARFSASDTTPPGWLRSAAKPFAKIAAVGSAWIASQMLIVGAHSIGTLFLVNSYLGDPGRSGYRWRYWYIEATVHIAIVVLIVMAVPAVRRLERRLGFWFPLLLLAPALVLRFEWYVIGGSTRNAIFQADTVIWLFLLGWAIQRAQAWWQRGIVTGVTLATVPGYFFHDDRSVRLLIGIVALIWVASIPLPRPIARLAATLASASLAIYLTHYAVFPRLDDFLPDPIVFPITIAVGVLTWFAVSRGSQHARRWYERRALGHPGDQTAASNTATA